MPEELYCPISHMLLTEAVQTSACQVYNEGPLREWLALHPGVDPISQKPINAELAPVYPMRSMAEFWRGLGYL